MNSRTIKSYVVAIVMSVCCAASMNAMAPGSMIDAMGKNPRPSIVATQTVNQPQQPVTMWNGATSNKQYQPTSPAMKWISGGAATAGAIWIARKVITKR